MPDMGVTKRTFLKSAAVAAAMPAGRALAESRPPNFVYINADDLGYGDLSCYGSAIRTPNIDGLARSGVRFRQCYAGGPVCSPSRAALMTGRYPTRVGVPYVLMSDSTSGLSLTETTVAQVLQSAGYRTFCVGKWHLGATSPYLPTNRGFDDYYGIPYSTDMWPRELLHNTTVVDGSVDLDTLQQRYTQYAVDLIAGSRNAPFLLYLAPATPHVPLAASSNFRGKSGLGLYGDAVQELDWSVGQVLQALSTNGIWYQTLVMFTSDHGPWYQGSAGRLRGRKGETFEGGMRTPLIASYPGRIPSGMVADGVATAMDILPTLANLAGAALPSAPLDGVDIWPLLMGEKQQMDRDALLYFDCWNAQCARMGRWKLHVARYNTPPWLPDPVCGRMNLPLANPELYDLERDPDESYDMAGDNPQVVADIQARMQALIGTFPSDVQAAWQQTMSQAVEATYSGQWPILKTS